MIKYNEYYCMACEKDFPIGNEYIFQDNYYKDIIHEKCPFCGSVDTLADVYDDHHATDRLLVPHPEIIMRTTIRCN